ncbi:hypothetical protein GCM10009804_38190 [Kribbella hippodromi]|uniref:Sec-independent protein translocase protein TatA n=1 Tax=Kribbella hippodromi TaxID=434347 RepID=A0ABP4PEH9_9ACTN
MVVQLALPEGGEWIVILVIVVLLFGAKKLPELTKNAARAMKEFEKARNGDDEQPAQVTAQPQPQPVQQQPGQAVQQPVQSQDSVQSAPTTPPVQSGSEPPEASTPR